MFDIFLYIAAAICFGLKSFGLASRVEFEMLAFCLITIALWIV